MAERLQRTRCFPCPQWCHTALRMLYERRVLLSMDSLSKVVSVASLSFKLLPGVACLMLWSLCKLSVTMVHPVLLHDHWVQDQVLGKGVTAQKQNLELPLSLN